MGLNHLCVATHSLEDISQRGIGWSRSGSLQASLTAELQSYLALSYCMWNTKGMIKTLDVCTQMQ